MLSALWRVFLVLNVLTVRLAVNAPEDNGSSSNAIPNPPRPPTDQGNNTPFLVCSQGVAGSLSDPQQYGQLPFRNSRYKEKFQALREKYDRVILKQQEYQQDLDLATAKIKKLQAENDLLLDAMNLAAAHQPSLFGLIPPSHTPPDMPPGGGSMDHDGFSGPSAGPMHAAERPPPRHMNGNGSSNGTSSSSSGHGPQTNGHELRESRPHASRQPSIEFIPHDMNGRAP